MMFTCWTLIILYTDTQVIIQRELVALQHVRPRETIF
jgi:hypothetical protein